MLQQRLSLKDALKGHSIESENCPSKMHPTVREEPESESHHRFVMTQNATIITMKIEHGLTALQIVT